MIEMLDVNLLNGTTATNVSQIFENNFLISNNNNIIDNSNNIIDNSSVIRYNGSTPTLSSAALDPSLSNSPIEDPNALLTGVIMNTTAIVVDYATQWLTSTIATTAANMSVMREETVDSAAAVYSMLANDTSAFNAPSAASVTSTLIAASDIDSLPVVEETYSESSTYYDSSTKVNGNTVNDDICPNFVDFDDKPLHQCHPQNPNLNCTIEEYTRYFLGPKTIPLALTVTIIYGGIFITGMLGNILICVVIVRHKALHTATNYYLFSLAVSDLIFLIFGLPAEVFMYWHQYPYLFGITFCKLRAYISEACSYVSVFTIVAFSVERYLAICHPLHLYAMSGFKRALRIIALLWVISFLGALPFGVLTDIQYLTYPIGDITIAESAYCIMSPQTELYVFEISFLVFFLIPMLLIIYFYGRMGAKIRSSTSKELGIQTGSMRKESHHQQSRKAVIRMLAAVVLTFFVCWLPFHAQRLFIVYGKCYKYYYEINDILFSITGFAYYVSCTVNPILYNVMSNRYRAAFKDTLCGRRRSVNYNNGFARDQSSFRETTVATSCGNTGIYDRNSYGRSFRVSNNLKDRASIKSNNVTWKKTDFCTPLVKDIPENHAVVNSLSPGTNVVVCVENGINGRTKVFTENEAQATLLAKNDETCI